MKIWYSPYQLRPLGSLNSRQSETEGFLIKLQSRDFENGYADCRPWKLFGDAAVRDQLRSLRAGRPTPLLRQTLRFARLDGVAREKRRSLFESFRLRSHYTCTNINELSAERLVQLRELGFRSIKVKVGRESHLESRAWAQLGYSELKKFKWRFDFNGTGGELFLMGLTSDFRHLIEFIEDPIEYVPRRWHRLESLFGVLLAYDQPSGSSQRTRYGGIRVIKPARQNIRARAGDVITNSMDHPVGQSFAYMAAQAAVRALGRQSVDYGLQTTHLFKHDDFFREISGDSPFFQVSSGTGIGFDHLLKKLSWKAL